MLTAVLLAWTWYVHFWPDMHTANESIRLYFVQAVVETGRPELDAVSRRHGIVPIDRSLFAGHMYMDKAPGLSLLALPLYPVVRALDPAVGTADLWMFGILACWLTVTLPCWLLLWWLARALRERGASPQAAAIATLALALASPFFAYATLYFGHGLAAACVAAAVLLLTRPDDGLGSVRRRWAVGGLLGFAGLTDTPVFALGALVWAWAILRASPRDDGWALAKRLRQSAPIAGGLALGLAAQLAYNAWTFGDFRAFAYHHKGNQAFAAIHGQGLFGFHAPQLDVAAFLLFGPSRGLLYHSPWLAAAFGGLLWRAQDRDLALTRRLDAMATALISLLYLLLVSGFGDWKAGDSAYARHLVPTLPLVAPGLAHLWQSRRLQRPVRALLVAMIAVGFLLTIPTIATFPYHFARLERPVLELGWPLWLLGNFSPNVGRLFGWNEWLSAGLFGALAALPWWLAAQLPALDPPSPPAGLREKLTTPALALLITLLWSVALMATVPDPRRAVQVSRSQAAMLMGPDADDRAGNKPWHRAWREAAERRSRVTK